MSASTLTKEERLAKLVKDMQERQAKKDARAKKKMSKYMTYVKKARAKRNYEARVHPPPVRLPKVPDGMVILPDPEIEPEIPVRGGMDRHVFRAKPLNLKPDSFMEHIGQQPGFLEAMQENTKDPRVAKFIEKCGLHHNKSLTWIAKSCGLTSIDLARIWRDDKLSRSFFEIVNRMPENAKKVMDDSLGERKSCPRCDGMKRIEVPEKFREFFDGAEMTICPECSGEGFKITVGNAEDKKLIWEKVGWTKQKGGISVNVNMADHSVDSVIDEIVDDFDKQPEVLEHQP